MLQWVGKTLEIVNRQYLTVQIAIEPGATSSGLSGSQGFLILVVGIVLTFAFQLLLANFFIALGISYSDTDQSDEQDRKKGSATDYVKRQYIGNLGKIENGIVAVTAYGLFEGMTFPLSLEV